jgi:methylmalonyl-CoA/ethylmalonyl-CoA epimerase
MNLNLNQIGQIALPVADVDRAEAFFAQALGFKKLFRFGDLCFFDCAGVRLLVEKARAEDVAKASVLYFKVADIALAVRELTTRGVRFVDKPHLIAPMEDHDLWMTFFHDPDGHTLALMQEAPKGYKPAT